MRHAPPPCPSCKSAATRPSRRTRKERWYCVPLGLHAYRRTSCRGRFFVQRAHAHRRRVVLLFAPLFFLGCLLIVIEYRVPNWLLQKIAAPDAAGLYGDPEVGAGMADQQSKRAHDIARRAKEKVIWAISRHRGGEEGIDIVKALSDPNDPIYIPIRKVFRDAAVPDQLVEASLRDWTEGTSVLEIGRQ